MKNTIILRHGYKRLTSSEFKKFKKGDTIWGEDSDPEELQRWNINQKEDAELELSKYRCEYNDGWNIEEYALEYCECDEDGDFVWGSDYQLAEEKLI